MGMDMMDMEAVALVVVLIGQVESMEVELALIVNIMGGNLVDMEDMEVVALGLIEGIPPMDIQVVMEEALPGVMIYEVVMVALVRDMVDMAVALVVVVDMAAVAVVVVVDQAWDMEEVAMTLVSGVDMEVVVEVPFMEVEGDMVVRVAVDTILMGGRRKAVMERVLDPKSVTAKFSKL